MQASLQSVRSLKKAGGPCHAPCRKIAMPRMPRVTVLAQGEKNPIEKLSDNMGMPTDQGFFGFTPFAEQWVGRWAMLGFASSVVGEFKTGRGALGQLGIDTPSTTVLAALVAIVVAATVVGSFATGKKAIDNDMSKKEVSSYRNFFGLNMGEEAEGEALKMKQKGDFTTPGDNNSLIAETKAEGAPVDAFLKTDEIAAAAEVSRAMKAEESTPSEGPARVAQREMYPGEANDATFARNVEITNGRWAMMGFLASIVVEAATGNGILGQGIVYLKASGVLGAKSGF